MAEKDKVNPTQGMRTTSGRPKSAFEDETAPNSDEAPTTTQAKTAMGPGPRGEGLDPRKGTVQSQREASGEPGSASGLGVGQDTIAAGGHTIPGTSRAPRTSQAGDYVPTAGTEGVAQTEADQRARATAEGSVAGADQRDLAHYLLKRIRSTPNVNARDVDGWLTDFSQRAKSGDVEKHNPSDFDAPRNL